MDDFTSPPSPVQAAAARRAGAAPWARIGLLGIAAAALVAVAILAFGSTASPTGTLAAGTGTTGSTAVDSLNGGGPGGPGGRGGFGRGFGGITITAIAGSNLSLETADGWTRTITVDSGTTYSKSGATIALGDLAVGDQIGFRQTHETDGTWTIDSVVVIPPHAGGQVTAVNGSTITVTQRDGTTATITVTGSTTYKVNGNAATLADIKVGMFVVGEGTKNADGSITATTVRAGDKNGRGPGGHGPDGDADDLAPNSTAAPSATGTAS
jgi:uncharacterized protein DUF5666